jgi:hypothetical protein
VLDTEQSSLSSSQSENEFEGPDAEIEYERPTLYPKQEEAIFYPRDAFGDPARFSFIEAGTKTGKTVGCIAWLYEQALQGPFGNYWWIAPVSGQAKIAYTRMKNFYPPETLSPLLTPTPTLTLPNGNVIWFKSGEDPDNLYGDDVQAGVIDEASRLREEAWFAVRSTLTATGGPLRFIGNVKGRRNWFYALARKAQSGERGYSYHKIVAADAVAAKVLDADEIEQAKRDLPEHIFRELYLAEPSDDGGNPFGIDAISKCLEPLAATTPVVWGWDLAKSVDWTVGTALDSAGRTCRFVRFQKPWSETMEEIYRLTGNTPALVDSTGVGDPIVEMLQKKPGTRFEGYHFSSTSKQKLMEGLAMAVQQRACTIIADTAGRPSVQRSEMEDFEYQYTRTGVRYSAPPGFHDDAVMSLALAVEHRAHAKPGLNLSKEILNRTRTNLLRGQGRSLRGM